jgi:hypothetical protein
MKLKYINMAWSKLKTELETGFQTTPFKKQKGNTNFEFFLTQEII